MLLIVTQNKISDGGQIESHVAFGTLPEIAEGQPIVMADLIQAGSITLPLDVWKHVGAGLQLGANLTQQYHFLALVSDELRLLLNGDSSQPS